MFLIIHNPLSNNKKSKKTTSKIVSFFQKNNIDFILRSTLKIENLNDLLNTNLNVTDVLYCGGDGSINYLINNVDMAAIKQNIYLAQSGSGNDFLRSLKPIHTGTIAIGEAKTDQKTVRFINGCGLGVDAAVCHYVNNDTKKNKLSYFINAFRAFSSFQPMTMNVTVDGVTTSYPKTYFAAIQNGKYFGGGMKVAPSADPTTNKYQVIVAHHLNAFTVNALFMTIYSGLHTKIKKYLTILEGTDIQLKIDSPRYFQTDGEVMENVSEVSVKAVTSRVLSAFDRAEFRNKFAQKLR